MDIIAKLKDPKFKKAYTEKDLLDKIVKFAKKLGLELIYVVLLLYYVLQSSKTPTKAKSIIYAALGYFILPFDGVPDTIPGIGHVDDWVILLAAAGAVAIYITEDVKKEAKEKLHTWFGDYDVSKLIEVEEKISNKVN